jgi:hypothetical protein
MSLNFYQKQTKEEIQRQRDWDEKQIAEQRANDPMWTVSRIRVSDKARNARYKLEDENRKEQNRRDRLREQEQYIEQQQREYQSAKIKPRQSQAKTFKLNMRTGEILPAGPGAKKQNDRNFRTLTKDAKQDKYTWYKYGEQLSQQIKDMNKNPQTKQMYSDLMDEYEGISKKSMTGEIEPMSNLDFLGKTNWIMRKLEKNPFENITERENKTSIKWKEGQELPMTDTRSQYETQPQITPKTAIRWRDDQELPTPETRSQYELETPAQRYKDPKTRSNFELVPYENFEQPNFTDTPVKITQKTFSKQPEPPYGTVYEPPTSFQRPEPYIESAEYKRDKEEYNRRDEDDRIDDFLSVEDREARNRMFNTLFPSNYLRDNTLGVLPEDALQDIPQLNQSVGDFNVRESDGVFRGTDWIFGLNPNAQDVIDTPQLQTGTMYTAQEDEYKYKDVDDITPQDLITQTQYDNAFLENNPYNIDYGFLQDKIQQENDSLYQLQQNVVDEFSQIAKSNSSFVGGGYDINTSSIDRPDINPLNQYAQAGVQKWDDESDVNPIFLRRPITDENYSFGTVDGVPLTNQQQMTQYHYEQKERSLLNSLTQSAARLIGDNNFIDGTSNTIFRESLDRLKLSEDNPKSTKRAFSSSNNSPKSRSSGLYGNAGTIFNDTTVSNPRTMDSRVKSWRNTLANKKKYDRYSKNPMSYGSTPSVSTPSIQSVRDGSVPYRQPDRYFAANAVNLVRLGNQTSMKTDNEYSV